MTRVELEHQCMAIANLIDTEVVDRDPIKIPSFDFNTLYVWLIHPQRRSDGEHFVDDAHSPRIAGRHGPRDAAGDSVAEVARKLGIDAHPAQR